MRQIHLICNAHLDPVWLWEWEEGAAEALSTFRTAADFCETCESFVFNHNEALLYQWVEAYEPALFARIQRLVAAGRWHIMGGWFLQPDCNMPSGEAMVRQIQAGRTYFQAKFGVRPRTAINFDSFGHSRGLVQLLAQAGYDSYIFCRPEASHCSLPGDDFVWRGFDGSTVIAHRSAEWYLSHPGQAVSKITQWLSEHPNQSCGLVLWGIGNHGGGPSRADLEGLAALMAERPAAGLRHSVPEAYFDALTALPDPGADIPAYSDHLNYFGIGVYSSQARVKQAYRRLENELFAAEKLCAAASLHNLTPYPHKELAEAQRDLLFAQFHDTMPGSSIPEVEAWALQLLGHGIEIARRARARAFFALCRGQRRAADGEIPILVCNPHPYPVHCVVECEVQLPAQNWTDAFTLPVVTRDGDLVPSQVEQEHSNLNLDWRKRIIFAAELPAGQMSRFDCALTTLPARPARTVEPENGKFRLATQRLVVEINAATGLLDRYCVDGVDYLAPGAFEPVALEDGDDTWAMARQAFGPVCARFTALEPEKAARHAGVQTDGLAPVRVIEDGAVRMVVEALLGWNESVVCLRYKLPKQGTEVEIEVCALWIEKGRVLKLAIPTRLGEVRFFGQTLFGAQELRTDGEVVAQKWVGLFATDGSQALTVINDGTYASDFCEGALRLTLLRSPGYAAHPILDRPLVPQDRFTPRVDQGERTFTFWMNAGPCRARREAIDREALSRNEKPFALSCFPPGEGQPVVPALVLSDAAVQLTAFRQSEDPDEFFVRLFEPTGVARSTRLEAPPLGISQEVELQAYEVKTFRIVPSSRTIAEARLLDG